MKITTSYDFPPIPDRSMDWSAVDSDTYEPGLPIGRGPTEQAAIDDLMEQLGCPVIAFFILMAIMASCVSITNGWTPL